MPKIVIRLIFILIGIACVAYFGWSLLKTSTKKHSPEQTITHMISDINLKVFYNRPYKKGRSIFGDLVPFGKVWRTGANEATTFTTDKDIYIDGSVLKAGSYTLWTIPNKDSWKIIFNGYLYNWGVNVSDGNASRDPEYDVLTIEVPVQPLLNVVEQFSIYFQDANGFTILYLAWDQTAVAIPITTKPSDKSQA